MSTNLIVLCVATSSLIATPFLIVLNNIRVNAEMIQKQRIETVAIDYMAYLRKKANGDFVDQLIAEQLRVEEFAA